MSIKYYVLSSERKQLQEESIRQAVTSIEGPVGFYEEWPGEDPCLRITQDAQEAWRPFCRLIEEDEARRERCRRDYEARASKGIRLGLNVCAFGVHNLVCSVRDEDGACVTLIGGEFRVRDRKNEAEKVLEQFLQEIPAEQQARFRDAWNQIPEVSEASVLSQKARELELTGRHYLMSLKRLSDFHYRADLMTHDVAIALQSLIAKIEVLKIELKKSYRISSSWEARFEELIKVCEESYLEFEKRLEMDRSKYTYQSISQLIHECVDLYRVRAGKLGIQLRVDLAQQGDEEGKREVVAVCMDRTALRQALCNALDNAVKYSFQGTTNHPRWIDIVGRQARQQKVLGYAIWIKNLGIGIDQDELELVFEPGYQSRRRLDEERSGHGMGLTNLKKCVERHSGSIAIHSQPPPESQFQSRVEEKTGWLTTLLIWLPLQGPMGY